MKSTKTAAGRGRRPVMTKDEFLIRGVSKRTPSSDLDRAPKIVVTDVSDTARKARSDAFEAIHSAAASLHAVGAIDKTTMREFDSTCLEMPNLSAQDVRDIRKSVNVSQEVFAHYLGTNKSTVQKWESAGNRPSAMAQRLLLAVKKHGLDILS